jgi:hypothetical protein
MHGFIKGLKMRVQLIASILVLSMGTACQTTGSKLDEKNDYLGKTRGQYLCELATYREDGVIKWNEQSANARKSVSDAKSEGLTLHACTDILQGFSSRKKSRPNPFANVKCEPDRPMHAYTNDELVYIAQTGKRPGCD